MGNGIGIGTQSALLASIVGLALGLSMLLRSDRQRVVTLYSIFAPTVGGFYLALFFAPLTTQGTTLRFVAQAATLLLGALVPSAALGFFLEFLGMTPRSARNGRRVALLSAVLGLLVGLTQPTEKLWAQVVLGVWVFGTLSVSVWMLFLRMHQTESRIERARLMYLAYGAVASLVFACLDIFSRSTLLASTLGPLAVPAVGPVFVTLYLYFLSQTLLRLRLMDLHELLGKVASLTVLAVVLAALIAALTLWVKDEEIALFLFETVVAAFVILILIDPLRAKIEQQMVAIFFRERFELLRSLSNLRTRMVNEIDVSALATLLLDAFHETRRVTHASIYLLAEDRPGYRLLDHRGPQPVGFLDAAAARGLLYAASGGQKAVLLENLERRIVEYRSRAPENRRQREEFKRLADTRAALQALKAGVCAPLVGNDRVIGFLNLWDERVPEAYASDEIALVLDIAERLTTVIENSKLYERMREKDRLAALGEMAAGLAHEIRNPLGAIKGAAQCLEPTQLPGEEGEFLEVIVEEVNRLNGVVSAFLDYSRPLKQNFGPTDMNEVVTRTIRLIQNEIPSHLELKMELAEGLNKVAAEAEQLKQVLINLVQNSLQAMGEDPGKITVRTLKPERFGDFRAPEMIEVHVSDTGPGIPVEQQPQLFVPFFTTKHKGTGLGLAICQRIVKSHGGTITVHSRPGEGATFIIRLPALPAEPSAAETEATPQPDTPAPPSLPRPPGDAAGSSRSRRERRKRRAG